MVYSVAFIPEEYLDEIEKIGFDDSKKLSKEQRELYFTKINNSFDYIGWSVRVLTPSDISKAMLGRVKYNLNALAHDTTISLISSLISKGMKISKVRN